MLDVDYTVMWTFLAGLGIGGVIGFICGTVFGVKDNAHLVADFSKVKVEFEKMKAELEGYVAKLKKKK